MKSKVLATPPSMRMRFPLVSQLRGMAERAVNADCLALPSALRNHRLCQTDWQAVRVGPRIRGLGDQAVALAIRIRPKEFLAVGNLQIQEDVVRDDW